MTTPATTVEYVAMAYSVKDTLFVRDATTFRVSTMEGKCITVCEDDARALCSANNPLRSARSRYIDVRFYFLREQVPKGEIAIMYVAKIEQHANVLTNPLVKEAFGIYGGF